MSSLYLASVAAQAGLCLPLSQTPKKVFLWRGSNKTNRNNEQGKTQHDTPHTLHNKNYSHTKYKMRIRIAVLERSAAETTGGKVLLL